MKKIALLLFVLLASACTANFVESAQARDTLFSVEKSRGGTYGIFLTHDESVAYCTTDEELGQKASSLLEHHGEVVVSFKSKKAFTDTEGELFGADECQSYYNGEGGFATVILLDIYGVPSRN